MLLSGSILLGRIISSLMRLVHTMPFPSNCHFLSKHLPNPTAAATLPPPGWRDWGSCAAEPTCSSVHPSLPRHALHTDHSGIYTKSKPQAFRLFIFPTFLTWPRRKVGDFYRAKGRTQNRSGRQKGTLMERAKNFPSEQTQFLIHQKVMLVLEWPHSRAMPLPGAHCVEWTSPPHITAGHGVHL